MAGDSTISTKRVIACSCASLGIQPAREDLGLAHGLQHVGVDALAVVAFLVATSARAARCRSGSGRGGTPRCGSGTTRRRSMTRALRLTAPSGSSPAAMRRQLRQDIEPGPDVLAALGVVRGRGREAVRPSLGAVASASACSASGVDAEHGPARRRPRSARPDGCRGRAPCPRCPWPSTGLVDLLELADELHVLAAFFVRRCSPPFSTAAARRNRRRRRVPRDCALGLADGVLDVAAIVRARPVPRR